VAFVVGNRWVLSVISLFAYVLTKIAVAIFAGGIVFSVLLPEMHLGPLDSFWIGSIMLMYIVQRALGAPGEQEARRGSIFAAGLKLLPVFIFIIPGIICFALAASGKVPAIQQVLFDANGELIRDQAQKAFPLLVATVLPAGVRGIVVAGLLAALMSSLAGVFNASPPRSWCWSASPGYPSSRAGAACTTISRACRRTWRRRSSWCSFWASSSSGSTRTAPSWRWSAVSFSASSTWRSIPR